MAFHPPKPVPAGLWRRTPPAVFPVILGLFGLGLGWRRATAQLGWPHEVGETILGAVTGLFALALLAYAVKLARRPGVLVEDLAILPGQAGLATMCMSVYLAAAAIGPYAAGVARPLLLGALVWHGFVALTMFAMLVRGPAERRRVSPVWHLMFVGFIVAGVAAQSLSIPVVSEVTLILTFILACAIWGASLEQARKERVPAPLRPLLAIHISPAALFGLVALGFDLITLAQGCAVLAALMFVALALRALWVTEAGFTPFWGAFTFPIAALASLWIGLGGFWTAPGVALFLFATAAIPAIAWRVLRLWARGSLATITNAAVA